MKLTSIDWLLLLLYLLFALVIGFSVRSRIKTAADFLFTGRNLPLWICALAFAGASVSAPEVIGMGALGARYGMLAAHFYGIAAIPAMVLLGLFLMPLYYGSKARSLPEFLGLRFDPKTRALSASLFVVLTVFSTAVSLSVVAGIVRALHVFDGLFRSIGRPSDEIFTFSIVLFAIIVAAYVFAGGLEGAMYTQVMQFCVFVAGLLPLAFLGLKGAGGWTGLRASLPAALPHEWKGALHASANPMGIGIVGLFLGLGFALGAGYWCTNFPVLQAAMASRDMDSARRVPLIAAIPKMVFPFFVILPGLLASGLPTPKTTFTESRQGDMIVHRIDVVPKAVEGGRGLVPAKMNPATGQPILDASGKPLLDYDMATPNMVLHYLPTGILGLGMSALLASFMSGMAGNVTAFNTAFTYDLYQPYIHQGASDEHYLAAGRWASVGGILFSVTIVLALIRFNNILYLLLLVFSIVNAPLFAAFLLGMFWKRTTGHGAFAGLLAGTIAALMHHGLTLPIEVHPGIHGGWIAVMHHYTTDLAQTFYGAIWAFGTNFVVAVLISLLTKARPEPELVGLVRSLAPRPEVSHLEWWKRPEALAVAVLLGSIALSIFFA